MKELFCLVFEDKGILFRTFDVFGHNFDYDGDDGDITSTLRVLRIIMLVTMKRKRRFRFVFDCLTSLHGSYLRRRPYLKMYGVVCS